MNSFGQQNDYLVQIVFFLLYNTPPIIEFVFSGWEIVTNLSKLLLFCQMHTSKYWDKLGALFRQKTARD